MAEQQMKGDANNYEGQFMFDLLRKYSDADASGDINKAFAYFCHACRAAMAYHELEERVKLENDWKTYFEERNKADEKYKNETERVEYVKKLKENFMETHSFFAYNSLPNMHLQKIEKEADIDYGIISLENITSLVRTNTGLPSLLKKVES
jgi:hypothetical protein